MPGPWPAGRARRKARAAPRRPAPGRSVRGRAARRAGAQNPPGGRRRIRHMYKERNRRPGGAAGRQAMAGGVARAREAQLRRSALGARRSALGARRSALGARRSALGARRSALGARRSALGARRSALGARRSALGARRSALGARRSALGARRSALGARRSALGARRSALGARRSALGARRSALGARRSALGARRSALGARRSALGARRSALGARRSALGARRSALGARRSALGARRSALGARRSALGISTASRSVLQCQPSIAVATDAHTFNPPVNRYRIAAVPWRARTSDRNPDRKPYPLETVPSMARLHVRSYSISVLVLHPAVPDPRIHETGYRVGAWRWPRGRFLYGAKSPFFSWTRSPASTPYCETGDSSGERAL